MGTDINFNAKDNTVESISDWFKKAKPNATAQDLIAQYAIFIEEIGEVFSATNFKGAESFMEGLRQEVLQLASEGEEACSDLVSTWDRKELLDGLADVMVTAVGVAQYANMNMVGALEEVSESNWSKFDKNGKPIINEQGKITKGPDYFKPNLEPFI